MYVCVFLGSRGKGGQREQVWDSDCRIAGKPQLLPTISTYAAFYIHSLLSKRVLYAQFSRVWDVNYIERGAEVFIENGGCKFRFGICLLTGSI